MATILPDSPPTVLPPEVLRVFRFLKSLPDDYFIWHHLAPWQKDSPDFLIITKDRRTLLMKVSNASPNQATPAAQLLLLGNDQPPLGQAETLVLNLFLESLEFISVDQDGPISTLVVFPNVSEKQVQASRLTRKPGEPLWAGKEWLQSESAPHWSALMPSAQLDPILLEKVRQAFTPEIVVPSAMTVRPSIQRRLDAGLTDYLLDYNQEYAVKSDLELPQDVQSLPKDFRLNIINGIAGSGKTLILLYRLRILFALFPQKHYLVLTHNRPLIRDMQSRFCLLNGRLPENIEWNTFNGWCRSHWPKVSTWTDPISHHRRQELVHGVWQQYLKDTTISEHRLISEIDWLKDQPVMSRDEYLAIERRGRGFRLTADQREQMFAAMSQYDTRLHGQNRLDWGDIPRRMWEFIQENQIQLPLYDMILLDEAQFFAPIWFALLQKVIKPQVGHLFLVADPTQGFLGRGTSWKSLGLDAKGRTQLLRKSYRSTQEILKFATLFYRLRLPDEKDEEILAPDLFNMPNGATPEIIPLNSPQDEIARVTNEVGEFITSGHPKRHLLILHANWQGAETIIQALDRKLGKNAAIDPKDTFPGDYIRVTTINRGAGLESPIVFLVGLHELFEAEQSLRISDDEREALIHDNTRKIYMAATRAGQRLVFTYVGELPIVLKRCFSKDSN